MTAFASSPFFHKLEDEVYEEARAAIQPYWDKAHPEFIKYSLARKIGGIAYAILTLGFYSAPSDHYELVGHEMSTRDFQRIATRAINKMQVSVDKEIAASSSKVYTRSLEHFKLLLECKLYEFEAGYTFAPDSKFRILGE
jgi:hypothetical protein